MQFLAKGFQEFRAIPAFGSTYGPSLTIIRLALIYTNFSLDLEGDVGVPVRHRYKFRTGVSFKPLF